MYVTPTPEFGLKNSGVGCGAHSRGKIPPSKSCKPNLGAHIKYKRVCWKKKIHGDFVIEPTFFLIVVQSIL